jgi:hypothetical protein
MTILKIQNDSSFPREGPEYRSRNPLLNGRAHDLACFGLFLLRADTQKYCQPTFLGPFETRSSGLPLV